MSLNDREPPSSPGVWESLRALWNDFRGLLHDHLALAALEIQRAAESLISMMVFGLVLALLLASAWFAALGLLIVWLIDIGFGLNAALLLALALNLIGAVGLVFAIRHKSNNLKLSASLDNLLPDAKVETLPEEPEPALLTVDDRPEDLNTRVSS
ncbi:MAG: phage holin family protein [Pseudohongiellaceae bacterium]